MVSHPIPRAGSSRDGARTRHQRGMPRAAGDRIGDARLLQRLARPRPLTILRAPSGFGKSSIVAQWLRATVADTADVVWLGADVGGWGGDDAPDTFWRALASRLDELEPGEEARRWGDAREAVTDMLSRRKDPVYVVLDRYSQMVPGRSEVDRALTELLHTCENFFLIVCTREVSSLEVVGAAIVDSRSDAWRRRRARRTPRPHAERERGERDLRAHGRMARSGARDPGQLRGRAAGG